MEDMKNDFHDDGSVIQYSIDTALYPLRVATSPTLLRTYLRTALLLLTSTILFGFAFVAYSTFYYAYIPVRGVTVPVYLQFDHGTPSSYLSARPGGILGERWPYGVADIHGLIDRQKYDVVVEMEVPRSATNLDAGNWMLVLEMRGPSSSGGVMSMLGWDEEDNTEEQKKAAADGAQSANRRSNVLAVSRRPALLTYRSQIVELVHRLLRLPLYVIGWHTESEHVEISMFESVIFEQGHRNVPSSVRLEIRSKRPLEVYRAKVRISARLEGLRWLMHRYWLTSATVGATLFWGVEMGVVLFTWAVFTLFLGKPSPTPGSASNQRTRIKRDPDPNHVLLPETDPETPFSDTSRTFPTLPSQQPLSYTSPKEERATPSLEDIPIKEDAEADDEDDDFILEEPVPPRVEREGLFTDSGIGTSMESSVERSLARRRSGRLRDESGG